MVITGSRTGMGETGRLRIDPKPLVVDEIEAEQDAVQTVFARDLCYWNTWCGLAVSLAG